ncbi:hypothetical protein NFI96_028380, partial [Prochilodus magdalenae]
MNREALPFGVPNGKACFTCVNNDCTGTVNCAGDEDQCISATVQCYMCQIGSQNDTCTDFKTDCPDQCISITTFISTDGQELQQSVKGCAAPEMCIRESINLGVWKFNNNAKCCSTDLCNSEIMPALQCHQCIPGLNGTCTDTQKNCSDQCGSVTVLVSAGGQEKERKVKDCATTEECVNGSLNLGFVKMTINTKCCNTDLCNNQTVPALPFGAPNGKTCFTCVNNDCTGTVNCAGDEDQCISATVTSAGVQVTVKGCASRSVCAASASSLQAAGITGNVTCCEGDLCNSAT